MTRESPARGAGAVTARLHARERPTGSPLTADLARLRRVRRIGTTGAVAMAVGPWVPAPCPCCRTPWRVNGSSACGCGCSSPR